MRPPPASCPCSVGAGDTLVHDVHYNNLGNITDLELGNGLRTTYGYYGTGGTYDTTGNYYGKLWEIKTTSTSTANIIQDIRYSWDPAGNLFTRQNLVSGAIESFSYDNLDRLRTAYAAGGGHPYSESYDYDNIGNIITKNGQSYVYGSNKPHAVTSVGETEYTYDANGNMVTKGEQDLTWDPENRLLSISGNDSASSFRYDDNGQRVIKTENGETILYVNDYFEINLTSGEETSNYYFGGNLVAIKNDSGLQYVLQDHLGSATQTTNEDGEVSGTAGYLPYGASNFDDTLVAQKFTGQRLDGSGLYYYNARYYDPDLGRFISPDTIVQDPANPQNLNRYYILPE